MADWRILETLKQTNLEKKSSERAHILSNVKIYSINYKAI